METVSPEQLATYDALVRFFDAIMDSMDEWGDIDTSDLCEDAVRFGLAADVAYDPERHGEMDAELGDSIYVLSALGLRARGRANEVRRAETLGE